MSDIPWIRAKRAIEDIRKFLDEAEPANRRSMTELRELVDQVEAAVVAQDITKREATWLAADAIIVMYGLRDWQQLLDATIDSIHRMIREGLVQVLPEAEQG
jgi:hypothetical protein